MIRLNADSDLLVVRAEDNLDYHKGVLQDVTEDVVRFDFDGEMLPVKRSKVFGFVYRHGKEANLPPTVCRIIDSAGSQWSVQSLALAGKLRWTTPAGLSVAQPLDSVAEIDFSGGKLAYFERFGAGVGRLDALLWRRASASRGATVLLAAPRPRLSIARAATGRRGYAKGLALYCRTELVYRLPARFSRFQAVAGIDDAVRPNGKVRLVDPRRRQAAAGSRHSGKRCAPRRSTST